jgi:hypothetical protein
LPDLDHIERRRSQPPHWSAATTSAGMAASLFLNRLFSFAFRKDNDLSERRRIIILDKKAPANAGAKLLETRKSVGACVATVAAIAAVAAEAVIEAQGDHIDVLTDAIGRTRKDRVCHRK